jgi:ribosomal-protein-alanine N-acetyltransferase
VTRVEGIRLERPAARHAAQFLSAVRASRVLHRGLASPPKDGDGFAAYVAGTRRGNRQGFFVMTSSGDLAGVINVSEIVRGNFRSAYLGYYAFMPHAGRGYMRQGLALVVSRCFRRLGLHRLEANIQPGNVRSIALVRGLGFKLEGRSPRYLKVCGRWRDHERWALLAEDWCSADRGSGRR